MSGKLSDGFELADDEFDRFGGIPNGDGEAELLPRREPLCEEHRVEFVLVVVGALRFDVRG